MPIGPQADSDESAARAWALARAAVVMRETRSGESVVHEIDLAGVLRPLFRADDDDDFHVVPCCRFHAVREQGRRTGHLPGEMRESWTDSASASRGRSGTRRQVIARSRLGSSADVKATVPAAGSTALLTAARS